MEGFMPAIPDLILPLSDTSVGLEHLGGKGASLARLAEFGYFTNALGFMNPVPT
jgi:hypothetical protein